MMMGFLSNNITASYKQTAAFLKVSNKKVQISSLMQIMYFLFFAAVQHSAATLPLFSTLQQSKQETWEQCKHFPEQGIKHNCRV